MTSNNIKSVQNPAIIKYEKHIVNVFDEKPYFKAIRKDFTKVFECDEYKCDAHSHGCLFCKHSTDIFWDFTHGPYMIVCDLQKENDEDMTPLGFIGECNYFKE